LWSTLYGCQLKCWCYTTFWLFLDAVLNLIMLLCNLRLIVTVSTLLVSVDTITARATDRPYGMRQKKTLTFDTFFQACICGAAAPQVGRLLLKSAGFVHTQVSKTPCSFTYGSFGAVFVSSTTSFVTEMEVVMQTRQNTHQFF